MDGLIGLAGRLAEASVGYERLQALCEAKQRHIQDMGGLTHDWKRCMECELLDLQIETC